MDGVYGATFRIKTRDGQCGGIRLDDFTMTIEYQNGIIE